MAEERIFNFQKLTPTDNVELGVYLDALDKVFAEDDIKNVAISGAYSSGKSSVLESYKKIYPKKKFLHISLAHFEQPSTENINHPIEVEGNNATHKSAYEKDADKPDENGENRFSTESILEGKILNQLIHQIDPTKIPQTNFRVKQKVSKTRIAISAVLVVGASLALLYVLFFEKWLNFVVSTGQGRLYSILEFTTHPAVRIIAAIFVIICFVVFFYQLISLQKAKSIVKKINIKGTDIEILGENKDSYFDRYLNEVLYLFDNSKSDVIVFEDMDRYKANQIFERLREVNTLINNQRKQRHKKVMDTLFMKRFHSFITIKPKKDNKKIEKHRLKTWLNKLIPTYRPLRFFYLLRDDIFTTKDRTKFFDYIIPVVPVIDGSNSYDQFIEKFKKGGIYSKFDPHFLQKLSLYVDDMRLLLNIYNEFLIYEARINSTEQDWNKMLAMITYKNLFPRDFSELQLGKGFVGNLLRQKQDIVNKEIAERNALIIDLQEKIEKAKDTYAESAKEIEQISSGFKAKITEKYRYTSNTHQEQAELASAEALTNKWAGYIGSRRDDKVCELNIEIENVKKQIAVLKNKRGLTDVITRENIDLLFKTLSFENDGKERTEFLEIKKNPYFDLLKFLLRNGHIDESYSDYMTYFYPNSLSVEDKTFLRSITDKKAKEMDYKINDPSLVLSYLDVADFRQPEALNIYIFKHLLDLNSYDDKCAFWLMRKEKDKYTPCLDALYAYLMLEKNIVFFVEYIRHIGASDFLVKQTCSRWPEFIKLFIEHRQGGNDDPFKIVALNSFVLTLFDCETDDRIMHMNIDNCLTEYIQNSLDFLKLGYQDSTFQGYNHNKENHLLDVFVKCFDLLSVKFKFLDYEASNKGLFKKVYEHDQYELNKHNIWLILKTMYGLEEKADFSHRNLTIIMSTPESSLANYVWGNIDIYMTVVLDFCNSVISDDERVALNVLNCKEIDGNTKLAYLSALKTKITKLSDASFIEIWKIILAFNLCENTQDNVLSYFEQHGLDDTLVRFINSHEVLRYNENISTDNLREKFFNAITTNNDISDDRYSLILTSIGLYYDDFDIMNISETKMDILLENRIIVMTAETLPFIRENYPNDLMHYVEKNIVEYATLMSDELFLLNETLDILKLKVADEHKIKLLGFTNEPMSVLNMGYTDAVKAYILTNNFNQNDLSVIVAQYPKETASVKLVIERIAVAHIDSVFDNNIVPPISLFDALLAMDIDAENRLELFALVVGNLEKNQFRNYLPQLGLEEYNNLFERKQACIPNTSKHAHILSVICNNKHWISSYKPDDKDSSFFRAYPFIPHKAKK